MGKEALTLRDISKYYTSGQSVVMGLNSVSLTFRTGEFVAITGESGSGKSTLAKVMAGILPYESGEMLLFGRPTSHYDGADWEHYRSDSISFISQSYDILPGCTVLRNVVSALRLTGMEKDQAAERAEEILKEVELWEMKNRRAAKLSSGQKQRLSIARALAKPAPILIADEPTGNLDKENSAKVIELLHAAAKDRLVVIITHEFHEVADHATRHISLQDGIVTSDIVLRPHESAGSTAPVRKRTVPKGLSRYTAFLQMGSRPVWSGMMLLFFTLTAFAIFAFLGTFIVNLDDTHTRLYDPSAFRNGDRTRIVAARNDGQLLTDSDITALQSIPHVLNIERYGYLADVNYFYREGKDYFSHYSSDGGSMTEDATTVSKQVTLESRTLFMKTVPVLPEGQSFLTGGRLPENMFEIVAGDESLLGETITVYIQDSKNWGVTAKLPFEMTVVGTTDYGAHLYFDEQLGRAFTTYMLHGGAFFIPCYDEETELDGLFLSSAGFYRQMYQYINDHRLQSVKGALAKSIISVSLDGAVFRCYSGNADNILLQLSEETHSYGMLYSFVVSPENFEKIAEQGYCPQMCLTIEDYAYTDDVLNALYELGYSAISPYQQGSTLQDEELAAERMQTLKICLVALIAVIALQVVVLRAMFSMETEEYRLLANLGLRCKNARLSVLWQILTFALGGEALAAVAIALCGMGGIERIVSVLRYLPVPYMLLTWAVHLAASLLTCIWIAGALRRAVYPVTGIRADLDMDDEEVEA